MPGSQPVQPMLQTVQPVALPAQPVVSQPVVSQPVQFMPHTAHPSHHGVQYQMGQPAQGTAMYQPVVMQTTAQAPVQGTGTTPQGTGGGKAQGGGMKTFQRVGSKVRTAFSRIRSKPRYAGGDAQPVGGAVRHGSSEYVHNTTEFPEVTVQNVQVAPADEGQVPGMGEDVPEVLPEMEGGVGLEAVAHAVAAEGEVGGVSAEQAAPVEDELGVESVEHYVPVDEEVSYEMVEHAVPVEEEEPVTLEEACAAEELAPVEEDAEYVEVEEVHEVQLAESAEDSMAQITENSSITAGLQQLFLGE